MRQSVREICFFFHFRSFLRPPPTHTEWLLSNALVTYVRLDQLNQDTFVGVMCWHNSCSEIVSSPATDRLIASGDLHARTLTHWWNQNRRETRLTFKNKWKESLSFRHTLVGLDLSCQVACCVWHTKIIEANDHSECAQKGRLKEKGIISQHFCFDPSGMW